MVLQPVADLFNHASQGCDVSFDHSHFTVTTDRAYDEGEEVYICYGRHGNDFLLVEYGFILSSSSSTDGNGNTNTNKWDEISLDEILLPQLSKSQKEILQEVGFLGNYVLDSETVCHRTQVALRLLLSSSSSSSSNGNRNGRGDAGSATIMTISQWRAFVAGETDGQEEEEYHHQERVDALLVRLLRKYLERIDGVLGEIAELGKKDKDKDGGRDGGGEAVQRETLALRWLQIRGLVEGTVSRLES